MERKRARLRSLLSAVFFLTTALPAIAVEVGGKAPDFELPSTVDSKFKLSSLQGKKNVLIQFYVLDFTPT